MRDTLLSRFTPSLLSGQALERLFVQREPQASAIMAGIRESVLTTNKHYCLVTGPRGMGKTHLVSLIHHRVVSDPELTGRVRIAWLREDAWGIASYLDLLLAIVRALEEAKATPEVVGAHARIVALGTIEDARDAAERTVLAAAGSGTLLLICENLDAIFEGLGTDGQHQLRALFQNHPVFTVLATSQSLFDGVTDRSRPFYGFFRPVHLREFGLADAIELLRKVAEHEGRLDLDSLLATPLGRARVRVVHHLAAGNPRVYIIFSTFLTRETLDELIGPVLQTLDDLTPYYQARMAHLSPQQRKLVEYLCEQRAAVQVHTIASANFITPQTVSSQLRKLAELGYVQSTSTGRESFYELREPLLRLTLEVKRHRGAPVQLILEFLRLWYSETDLTVRLGDADSTERGYLEGALALARYDGRDVIAEAARADLRRYVAQGDSQRAYEAAEDLIVHAGGQDPRSRAAAGLALAESLLEEDRPDEAIVALDRVVADCVDDVGLDPVAAMALVDKANCLARAGRLDEAVRIADEVLQRFGERNELALRVAVACALAYQAMDFAEAGRLDEALRTADEVVRRFGESTELTLQEAVARALVVQAVHFTQAGRRDDALRTAGEVVRRFGERTELTLQKAVARALGKQALLFAEAGRLDEALRTANDVVRRFGERTELTLQEAVARAMAYQALFFAGAGRLDEALRTANEVVRRFGERTELTLQEAVARAMAYQALFFAGAGRLDEALRTANEVVRRFGDRSELTLREAVARALGNQALHFAEAGRPDEALRTADEVVRRFGEHTELPLQEAVAHALGNQALDFAEAGRLDDALRTADEVVRRFGDCTELSLQEAVARALVNQALLFAEAGRLGDALRTADEVVRRFGDCTELTLQEAVARALVNQALHFARADRLDDALRTADEVARRFGERTELPILEQVARALVNQALHFARAGRLDDALRTAVDVVRRFGDRSEMPLLEAVARASVNQANHLARAGRLDDALRTADDFLRRFGQRTELPLENQVVHALVNQASHLARAGRLDDALRTVDEVLRRFGESTELPLQQQVARALVNQANHFAQASRLDDALRTADEVVRRFGESTELPLQQQVARAMVNQANHLARAGRLDDALRTADEILRRVGDRTEPTLTASALSALWIKFEYAHHPLAGDLDLPAVAALVRRRDQWGPTAPVSLRVAALFSRAMTLSGLGEHAESEELAADAAALLLSEPGGDHAWAACLVPHLLRRDPATWKVMIGRLIAAFDAAGALATLSVGLARSVRVLVEAPHRDGEAWLRAWAGPASTHPQLEVGLRMLRAGVHHLQGDATALHRLASEERALVREMLPA